MRSDCCRSAGLEPAPCAIEFEKGKIPGAVPGKIPEEYSARIPIYLDGPVSLDEFLTHSLDMSPPEAEKEGFLWPVTSRFSFVASVLFVALSAFCSAAEAHTGDESAKRNSSFDAQHNVKIAVRTETTAKPDGRIISFVCGRPTTLQAIAPMDLPRERAARLLPQGASPIAEMTSMPATRADAIEKKYGIKTATNTKQDAATNDRVYKRLLKLSLADPAGYEAEGSSLITYFSILTGGQDQKRVQQLEKILELNLNTR